MTVRSERHLCAPCGHRGEEHASANDRRPNGACCEAHYDYEARKRVECECSAYQLSNSDRERQLKANALLLKIERCDNCRTPFPLFIEATLPEPGSIVYRLLELIPHYEVPCATWTGRTDRGWTCGCVEHRGHMEC